MTRQQLEHLIRAASVIADDDELIIIGSQSILGAHPSAPNSLLVSVEADIYPKNRPERAALIDGTIGELSPFHDTYGYYARGVGPTTAVLPAGWDDRLVPIRNENTRWATGLCLDPHDLLVAKHVAGREKDLRFIRDAVAQGWISRSLLEERVATLGLTSEQCEPIAQRIASDFSA